MLYKHHSILFSPPLSQVHKSPCDTAWCVVSLTSMCTYVCMYIFTEAYRYVLVYIYICMYVLRGICTTIITHYLYLLRQSVDLVLKVQEIKILYICTYFHFSRQFDKAKASKSPPPRIAANRILEQHATSVSNIHY